MSDEMRERGVYAIENLVTGADYVGGTANSFRERWNQHKSYLRKGNHPNDALQKDWNTHGEQAFEFIIVEPINQTAKIWKREQYWINVRNRYCKPEENYNAVDVVMRHYEKPVVRRIVVDGVEYTSVQAAADAHGISRQAMAKRLKREA